MKRKKAIAVIKKWLPIVKIAALLKGDKKGEFEICTTLVCVNYQLKRNPKKVLKVYNEQKEKTI